MSLIFLILKGSIVAVLSRHFFQVGYQMPALSERNMKAVMLLMTAMNLLLLCMCCDLNRSVYWVRIMIILIVLNLVSRMSST